MKNETLRRYFTDSPAWKCQLQQLRKKARRILRGAAFALFLLRAE